MKKILVPTDFSDCSLNALKYAINLGKLTNRELLIIHAIQLPALANGELETSQEILDEIEDDYKQLKERLPELSNIGFDFEISYDFLVTSVRKKAKEVDFVVLGTTGASGAKEVLMGSNTYDVIKEIDLPIFAIPENSKPFAPGAIAFACDYKHIDKIEDIRPLIELAQMRDNEIHILHIGEENNITREELEVGRVQDQFFKQVRHSYHFIKGTNIAEELNRYIEANAIHLLTLYARKHSLTEMIFHKSLTKDLALHSEIPLLVLPETN